MGIIDIVGAEKIGVLEEKRTDHPGLDRNLHRYHRIIGCVGCYSTSLCNRRSA